MSESAGTPHEMGLLLALSRVHGGQVTARLPDVIADGDEPFPSTLLPFLRELFANGQVRLDEQHGSEQWQVLMSTAGEDLLAELEEEPTN